MELTDKDLEQLENIGISEEGLANQLHYFEKGFNFLELDRPCTIGDGIMHLLKDDIAYYNQQIDGFKGSFAKFTPASGAASRMFKPLFEFLSGSEKTLDEVSNPFVFSFFKSLDRFAFYPLLKKNFEKKEGYSLAEAHLKGEYHKILNVLLSKEGMNYGQLPKGLIEFHTYESTSRTAVEEQAEEAKSVFGEREVHLHFTISKEFEPKVKSLLKDVSHKLSFSEQKSSTDTVAVNLENEIIRDETGKILFRPAGHGALLENLNAVNEDIIFIKNIDNVQPDHQKSATIEYKKLLGGVLIHFQSRLFKLLKAAEAGNDVTHEAKGLLKSLGIDGLSDGEVLEKLNRPIRVCGMVKNVGDPGGGPFWVSGANNTSSLQIIESAQVNNADSKQQSIFNNSTHFNPVDIVCGVKNYKGEKFNLLEFRDDSAGFIAEKSFAGKTLKAMELPGLWNGSMSDWNTIFVEVPGETFSPVKTVNDLIKPSHQPN